MNTTQIILNQLRANYPYLAAEYGVSRIGLFGSYAMGTANETSDVDLVVEFQRPLGFKFMELADHLEKLLGKKVDLLTPAGVEGIRLRNVASTIDEYIICV
jgi:predicted nucleotidyltransferase